MLDVITIGSATVDVFGVISQKFKEVRLGDKVLLEKVDFETGGGGINSAVALSRMGLKTAFLGKLGHDYNAFKILHELKKENVKVIKTKPSKEHTSYSFILKSEKEQDRIIFTHKGSSDHLSYGEFNKSELKTRWIYLATMLKGSFSTAEKIAGYAKKHNIKLMFNPSTYLAVKGKFHLRRILRAATIIVLNKSEAQFLLQTKSNKITDILKGLRKTGPEIAVVTEGEKGINAYDGENYYYLPAYKVKVVSTAGAGDAFASGFLAGILHKENIVQSLKIGMANAASVIQYYGTKNNLLTYKQAKKFIIRRKENVIVKESS
ncbi:carbohydrate kinase family protein [Candidatus Woesearchaeota archaeon]|nr:carbohydrate kinase family protein [Candidatus Woesearchaeota archaeon]